MSPGKRFQDFRGGLQTGPGGDQHVTALGVAGWEQGAWPSSTMSNQWAWPAGELRLRGFRELRVLAGLGHQG